MSESDDSKNFKNDIDQLLLSIDLRIDSHLKALKAQSSTAVLSGSVKQAQEMLIEIQLIEDARQKMSVCHKEFIKELA